MRNGRPPKPANLRVLTGNAGHRPIPAEPTPLRRRRPCAPTWLSALAREEWDRVTDELWRMGVVVELDVAALAGYAESFARWRTAEEAIAATAAADPVAKGLLARMPSGAIVQSPLVGIARRAKLDMLRFASELGLTPAGRVGLEGAEMPADHDAVMRKYFGRN